MSRLYQRNETWWGDWYDANGKRQQRSMRTADKSVAKGRLKLAELGPAVGTRPKAQSLEDAIDYMITVTCHDKAEPTREMYRQKGRRLVSFLGNPDVNDLSRDILSDYVSRRLKGEGDIPPASQGTVQKELVTMRRALSESAHRKILRSPISELMPRFRAKYTPRERWLTVAEFEDLCVALKPERVLWAAIATLAGLRSSEVERLRWRHIDLANGWLHVPGTKTLASKRKVPISEALEWRLQQAYDLGQASRTPGAPVVSHWHNVRRDLHEACSAVGIDRVSPNDLRRTFASWLKQHGADSQAVATMMGHKSTRMIELVYGKLDDASYLRAMALVPVAPRRIADHS